MEIKKNVEIGEKVKFIKTDYIQHQKKMKIIIIALSIIVCISLIFLIKIYKKPTNIGTKSPRIDTNKKKTEKPINEIFTNVKQSIVLVLTFDEGGIPISQGSGFFIEKCKILTNRHVLRNAYSVKIKSQEGEFQATEISADNKNYDLVILSVPDEAKELNLPPLNQSLPEVGEKVIVIGSPFGLETTVSDGIVSATREIKNRGTIIQITSPISPGSSGSPVFNLQGEVIGVASFQIYEGQNLNFAIPISKINELTTPESSDISSLGSTAVMQSDSLRLAIDFFEKKDYDTALTNFQLALEENPQNAAIHFYIGMCYKENNVSLAINEFLNTIKLDSNYADAYYMLGVAYMALKEYETASSYFQKLLEITPKDPDALFQLGIINKILDKNTSTLEFLQEISDAEPKILMKYYIGINYANINNYEQAELLFNEIIAIDSDFIPAYLGLGYVYLNQGKWDMGINQLSNNSYIDSFNEEIHYILGLLYLGKNDIMSAFDELEKLGEINKFSEYYSKLYQVIRERYPMRRRLR